VGSSVSSTVWVPSDAHASLNLCAMGGGGRIGSCHKEREHYDSRVILSLISVSVRMLRRALRQKLGSLDSPALIVRRRLNSFIEMFVRMPPLPIGKRENHASNTDFQGASEAFR
jgi:hypothetical protein